MVDAFGRRENGTRKNELGETMTTRAEWMAEIDKLEKRARMAEKTLREVTTAIAKTVEEQPEASQYYSPSWHFDQKEQELAAMTAERDRYKALAEELSENQKNGHLWPTELIQSDELTPDGNPARLAYVPVWCIDKIRKEDHYCAMKADVLGRVNYQHGTIRCEKAIETDADYDETKNTIRKDFTPPEGVIITSLTRLTWGEQS